MDKCPNNENNGYQMPASLLKERERENKDSVAPGFKNKTRYTPYVSPGSQISHIATNRGNIKQTMLIYNELNV